MATHLATRSSPTGHGDGIARGATMVSAGLGTNFPATKMPENRQPRRIPHWRNPTIGSRTGSPISPMTDVMLRQRAQRRPNRAAIARKGAVMTTTMASTMRLMMRMWPLVPGSAPRSPLLLEPEPVMVEQLALEADAVGAHP